MKPKHFYLSALCTLVACMPGQRVRYVPAEQMPPAEKRLSSIKINRFEDSRKLNPEAKLFVEPQYGSDNICRNTEDSYKELDVANAVSMALVEHLRLRAIYPAVFSSADTQAADYVLSGELHAFFTEQNTSGRAQVSSQLGLVGALAGAGAKSAGKVTIELKNLKLQNTRTKKTQNLQPLVYKFEGDLPIDGYCNSVYWNVNEHMALAFQQLEPQLLANTK